jgi:AcrR family transcriptional regulator
MVFCQGEIQRERVGILAEAAGVSKALIFHHFNSKKELYLALLDRCVEETKRQLNVTALLEYQDFFDAREKFSLMKYAFNKENADIYKVLKEAYLMTPAELKAEMEKRSDAFLIERNKLWEELFEKVPLREGVGRGQAFELVMLTLDYFDQKFLAEMTAGDELDETTVQKFLAERNSFLAMIRYGIEKQEDVGDDESG